MTIMERFMAKVAVQESHCWLWTGCARNRRDYGGFSFRGRLMGAHVVSWILHRGEVPGGLCVLHHCDVPRCVNPDHLWLGTNADNNTDRDRKGRRRQVRGEGCSFAKLTEEAVLYIRSSGETLEALADRYGVTPCTIQEARAGTTWGHVARGPSHAPSPCDRLNHTADFHGRSWSYRYECPTCGLGQRRNSNFLGSRHHLVCDGARIRREAKEVAA
ncbi:MAG: HNH endonuclease signature motif containing protein [Vicinamibacterales bacterium]